MVGFAGSGSTSPGDEPPVSADGRLRSASTFPIRALLGSLILSLLLLGLLAWHLWISYRGLQTTMGRDVNIQRLSGVVIHLDEVLTMSARMTAATGDLRWEQRYRAYEPQLDEAIREVMRLVSDPLLEACAAETNTANARLVEMEHRAFDLVRSGGRAEAMNLLTGSEYEEQKQSYAGGMKRLSLGLRDRSAADVRAQRRALSIGVAAGLATVPLLLVIWVLVLRGVARNTAERELVTRELQMHRENLAQLVAERTRELSTANEQLARSNAELQDFAYIASHDLQEPLRKILAFGDRLKAACADRLTEPGSDYMDRMLNAAGRMQTLIDDLLTYSRVTTLAQPKAPTDLNEVVRGVLSDLEVRIEQTVAHVDVTALPTVQADSTQMRQLFQNLIGNALKFRRADAEPHIRIWAEPANGMCRIAVEDDGIGFDDKYADRIFGVFQRLHGRSEYEGTGIGLAVCQKIAKRHGGEITAHGEPGGGAKFTVLLPVDTTGDTT